MGIIPLEKLIEYKGNRYELTCAMIELAKSGGRLLKSETKYRGGKYIPTVMKNILDGRIKYDYEKDSSMEIDESAPFKDVNLEYDENIYISKIEVEEVSEITEDEEEQIEEEEDAIIDDSIVEDEEEEDEEIKDTSKAPKRKRKTSKNNE